MNIDINLHIKINVFQHILFSFRLFSFRIIISSRALGVRSDHKQDYKLDFLGKISYLCLPEILARSFDILLLFSSGVMDLCLLSLSWLLILSTLLLLLLSLSLLLSSLRLLFLLLLLLELLFSSTSLILLPSSFVSSSSLRA